MDGGFIDGAHHSEGALGCQGTPSAEAFGPARQAWNKDRREWSGRRESNPRHSAWEADVLPLNYTRPSLAYIPHSCGKRSPPSESEFVCGGVGGGKFARSKSASF